ncbi:MAG: NTP transferase domain-containing protein [Gemmatimonadetes bacterium]|nr:NTP transferase domain-containing protein [Gemmatimonadota bacterium]
MIPVAGEGSRLRSVTGGAPKCLVEVEGRPLLHHLLDRIGGVCSRICVVIPPDATEIVAALRGHPAGARASVVVQTSPRGLRDAVCQALSVVTDPVLIVMGDTFFSQDPGPLMQSLVPGQGGLLVEAPGEDPGEPAGWVVGDAEGRAVRVWKGRKESDDARRIAGGFVLDGSALESLRSTPGEGSFESTVNEAIRRGGDYRILPVHGPRWNVNTPAQLEALRAWAHSMGHEDALHGDG